MRIIIVGCGKVGSMIARFLDREGHDIVVIDKDSAALEKLTSSLDIMGIEGNGADDQIQIEAGAESSDLLIAVAANDETNLLCCLVAKKLGVTSTIARVRNFEYNGSIKRLRDDLGLSMTINPERSTANRIARLLEFPEAVEIESFSRGSVALYTYKLPEASVLCGRCASDIFSDAKLKVKLGIVERDGQIFIPKGDFVLEGGDTLSILAPPKFARKFIRLCGIIDDASKNIIIVGGSRIAYYLARHFEDSNAHIKIIDQDHDRCMELSEVLGGNISIVCGDALDQHLLSENGIKTTDAFVALTGIDETNMLLSLYARSVSDAKTVTKVNRMRFDNLISNMDLGSVIHPKYLTAEYILRYVRAMQNSFGSNVETLYRLADGRVEALEFRVREDLPFLGIPLKDIRFKDNLLLGAITRSGKIIIPQGDDCLKLNDTVVVITSHLGLKDLKDIVK